MIREEKVDDLIYRFGYQGQFAERDEETGWNHFELREYDPVLGRWMVVDPKRQFYSPYVGMGNNPLTRVDPNGGNDGPGLFGRLLDGFRNWLTNLFAPASSDDAFNVDLSKDEFANKRVRKVGSDIEKAQAVSKLSEVQPYVSVSIGKEANENSNFSYNGTLTFTPSGAYLSGGGDYTLSSGNMFPGIPSLSLSTGLVFGPAEGLNGHGYYGTVGVYNIGVQGSGSFTNDKYGLINGFGNTYSVGLVLSTSEFWGGGGVTTTNTWTIYGE